MFSINKRWIAWAFLAILFIGLFGWAWRHRESVPFVTRPLVMLTTPFQYGTSRVAQNALAGIHILQGSVKGYDELQALRQENAQLKGQLTAEREVLAENARLRNLLGFRDGHAQYRLLGARVLARDYGSWTNTILIDRGSDDGIHKHMAVILPEGVVGFVSDVFPDSARVQLLVDPRTAVGGIVQRPTSRVASVVTGSGNDAAHPVMINIVKEGDIVVGDTIVTSGYGGLYPKGVLIGTVASIEPDPSGVVKRAIITPAVAFDRLEEVFVVLYADVSAPVAPAEVPNLVSEALPTPQAGGQR